VVDAERAAQFEEEGAHFESAYYLTFVFLPPAEEATRAEAFLYEGRVEGGSVDAHQILKGFVDAPTECCSLSRASYRMPLGSPTLRR